jgi:hypothetical protein
VARKFISDREIEFIRVVTEEFVQDVVDQVVFYYAIDLKTSRLNIYNESVKKTWLPPVQCNARILYTNPQEKSAKSGIPDETFGVEVYFHVAEMNERNLIPRTGDFVEFGQIFYEITGVTQPDMIFGQINNKTQYKCICVQSREGQFQAGGDAARGINNTHPIKNVDGSQYDPQI